MSEIDDILKAMLSDNKNENATSEETSGTENEEKFTTDTDSDDIFGRSYCRLGIFFLQTLKFGFRHSYITPFHKFTPFHSRLSNRPLSLR